MKFFTSIIFFFLALSVYSQSPDWSVNTNAYQYSMTFTVFLNVDGTTLTNTNDKIGAFINGEPRGEATVTYNANAKKHVAYLTVLSNTSGETINFKIYQHDSNTIIEAPQTATFTINGNIGGVFQSYSVAQPVLEKEAIISNFSFLNVSNSNATIVDNTINIQLSNPTNLNSLMPVFQTVNNAKVFYQKELINSGTNALDFSSDVILEVLSEDESVLKEYTVKVSIQNNTTGPSVSLSSNAIKVNSMPIEITLTAATTIPNLKKEDFEVENCLIYNISTTDNINFKLSTVAVNQGDFSVKLQENKVVDVNANGNLASNNLTIYFDNEAPKITEIVRNNPSEELNKANQIIFSVRFNEAVKDVSTEDFTSVTNASVSVAQQTDSYYLVTISNINNFTGTVYLQLLESNNITDLSNNALELTKHQTYEK